MQISHNLKVGSVVLATHPMTGKVMVATVVDIYGKMLSIRQIKGNEHTKPIEINIMYVKAIEPDVITKLRNGVKNMFGL